MINLYEYIVEKLHLDKNIEVSKEKKNDDPTTWDVGDILVSSSGYNMIIIDFYEIIKFTGKTFVLRKLKDKIVSGDGQRGESVPLEGQYELDRVTKKPEEIKARINKWNRVKIDKYSSCHLWDGKPVLFDYMD